MNRLPVLIGLMSASLILWPGCATKKEGCPGKCKTPCSAPCKTPCGHSATAAHEASHQPPCQADWESAAHFGDPMKLSDADAVCARKVLEDPDNYDGQFIRVRGKVASVCAKHGCSLRLGDATGKETVFVKFTCPFKDRLIPMEAVGKRALVEGTLQVDDISEEEARHYKEAAGASPDEIAKIVGPQKTVRMTSRSARIAGLEPATD